MYAVRLLLLRARCAPRVAPLRILAMASGAKRLHSTEERASNGGAPAWKKKKGLQQAKGKKGKYEGSAEDVLRKDILALTRSLQAGGVDAAAIPTGAADAAATSTDASDHLPPSTGAADEAPPFTSAAGEALPTSEEQELQDDEPPPRGTILDLKVVELSSTGDGLAILPGSRHIYVVPFSIPGDTVKAHVWRYVSHETAPHIVADFISVVKPSPQRDDSRIRCRYFASCSGCQFQMLAYPDQLRAKQRIVEKAFANFSALPATAIPPVADTIGSPLQYGYRTKLTPHFDSPPHQPRRRSRTPFSYCPEIGFMSKGKGRVLDIEDCPIGTDVVRLGMKRERARMRHEFSHFHMGATILLRESTNRCYASDEEPKDEGPKYELEEDGYYEDEDEEYKVRVQGSGYVDVKRCVTKHTATTTEYIGPYVFTNPAGSFFQNNKAILPVFTAYIRDHIMPPDSAAAGAPRVRYLIDAYSGSGLFTITLSSLFDHSTGIDVAENSIASARRNAVLNGLGATQARFIAADANELFRAIEYPPAQTVVVLDPPRKGCDARFLAQLAAFAPRRIVYVSCNVHTQARDVGVLVRGDHGPKYRIDSLVGFDFFPQTGHVEGVAILDKLEDTA